MTSPDLPAMRRFKRALVDGLANAPDIPPTAAALVADVEAEGNALIGAVPCGRHHGRELRDSTVAECQHHCSERCPDCGAAL